MTNPHCKCLLMRTNPCSEVMSSGERERERTCCKFQIDSSMHGMSLSFQFLPLLYPRNLWIFFIHENPTDHRHRTATL
jgi:hypothetical protein